jgi:hypothetical protein
MTHGAERGELYQVRQAAFLVGITVTFSSRQGESVSLHCKTGLDASLLHDERDCTGSVGKTAGCFEGMAVCITNH